VQVAIAWSLSRRRIRVALADILAWRRCHLADDGQVCWISQTRRKLHSFRFLTGAEEYNAIIPCSDRSLVASSAHHDRLRELVYVGCAPPNIVASARDQSKQAEVSRAAHGAQVPLGMKRAERAPARSCRAGPTLDVGRDTAHRTNQVLDRMVVSSTGPTTGSSSFSTLSGSSWPSGRLAPRHRPGRCAPATVSRLPRRGRGDSGRVQVFE
jgi:hypothetical protein